MPMYSFETPISPKGAPVLTPPPPPAPAPLSIGEARDLLAKCGIKDVFSKADLEKARANAAELTRLQADEKNLCDLESRTRRDALIARYADLVAAGDLSGARALAGEAIFPINAVQQQACLASIHAAVGKRRGVLAGIVEAAFQRTLPIVEKSLASFEAADRQYSLESEAETVQYRKCTIVARNWPQVGFEALSLVLREALASKK